MDVYNQLNKREIPTPRHGKLSIAAALAMAMLTLGLLFALSESRAADSAGLYLTFTDH